MNTDIFLKGFFAVIYGSICAWVVFSRYDSEIGSENTASEGQRYLPYTPSVVLPVFILCLAVWCFIFGEQVQPHR